MARMVNPLSAPAWAEFKRLVEACGGTVKEPEWLGNRVPHRVICREGHECTPIPSNVKKEGRGICNTCAGIRRGADKSAASWVVFKADVEAQGGTVEERGWLGAMRPHHVRCGRGHECYPSPCNVRQGHSICQVCACNGPASAAAEANFRARLAELGATLLETKWLGTGTPHHVRCSQGHDCYPRPNSVQQRGGICKYCAGSNCNVFYVVTGPLGLKLGISHGDGLDRLDTHYRDYGYATTRRLLTGLPPGAAAELEDELKRALPASGFDPVYGTEYFAIGALDLVLKLVDDHAELAPYHQRLVSEELLAGWIAAVRPVAFRPGPRRSFGPYRFN